MNQLNFSLCFETSAKDNYFIKDLFKNILNYFINDKDKLKMLIINSEELNKKKI